MTFPTVPVTVALSQLLGAAPDGTIVTATLDKDDRTAAGFLVQSSVSGSTAGGVVVLQCFPNNPTTGLGTTGSVYVFTASIAGALWRATAQIPNVACNLHDIATISPTLSVTDAQAAQSAAQAYAAQAAVSKVATAADAAAAHADRLLSDADAIQTAADRIQCDADVTAATNQANLAAASAASAASVVQQDLSGVSAVALHRSPNAVTAQFIYNTALDSDGGAWVERCQNLSWYNEALNGVWRGACATEAACRAIAGAATGDYFQLTTDGKFYKLNAGAGTTEVFRGNKAKPPRMSLPICEANSLIVYDAVEPGRPMWGRWVFAVGTFGNITSAVDAYGKIVLGTSLGLITLDLAKDTGRFQQSANDWTFKLTDRAAPVLVANPTQQYIVNNAVNGVAMTVLPDAPVDPVTGLQVPTIAVATGAGASVIKHDGSVINLTAASGGMFAISISKTGELIITGGAGVGYGSWLFKGIPVASTNTADFIFTGSVFFPAMQGISGSSSQARISVMANKLRIISLTTPNSGTVAQINGLLHNPGTPAAGASFYISDKYNTGFQFGAIVRCWLADVTAGAAAASEPDRSYKNKPLTLFGALTKSAVGTGSQLVAYSGFSAANYLQEPYSSDLDPALGVVTMSVWGTIPVGVAAAAWGVDRSAATGPYYRLGHDATGKLVAELFDGTTTRTLTTAAAYNTGQFGSWTATYTPAGAASTLTIRVNGVIVATSTFAALLTLSNVNAVCTVGIDRALTAPWAGSLLLVKPGMTAATVEQAAWMAAQEAQMFRAGAQVALPDAGAVTALTYDESQDSWKSSTATNVSRWTGLVRTSVTPVPAGSYSNVSAQSGIELTARITTNPGVDVTIPAQNMREELVNRSLAAARLARDVKPFNFDAIAAQTDFALPAGWTWAEVISNRSSQREGAAKDFTVLFDGFKETVRFITAPGAGIWVQILARRAA